MLEKGGGSHALNSVGLILPERREIKWLRRRSVGVHALHSSEYRRVRYGCDSDEVTPPPLALRELRSRRPGK